MARILRGVKSLFASSAWGGGLFSFLPVPACPLQSLCRPWAFIPAIFGRALHGFLDGCNFWPFLASVLACIALSLCCWVFPWVGLLSGLCGAFCGCYSFCLRAVSTCKGKKAPFCPSFALLACSLRLSLCASLYIQEKRPFLWVALSLVVVFGFSFQNSNTASGAGFLPYIFILWVSLSVSILRAVGLAI